MQQTDVPLENRLLLYILNGDSKNEELENHRRDNENERNIKLFKKNLKELLGGRQRLFLYNNGYKILKAMVFYDEVMALYETPDDRRFVASISGLEKPSSLIIMKNIPDFLTYFQQLNKP